MSAKKITIQGFLGEFQRRHEQVRDRPFCWILGSGASVQSGIPTGGALAQKWIEELHELEDFRNVPLEVWATAENLGIPGISYENAATFYPWIYERRFRDYKEQGYAFLEKMMEGAEPSFGYSVLAQIMATGPHAVAITTNFDNLIADALSIYTRTFPLVCGHESLAGYVRAHLRRPLVAKIHRDLLLAPLSNPDEISTLAKGWVSALSRIFDRYTPIVIGYGGNDGSLMEFLKGLVPIEGGIFWCSLEGTSVDPRIGKVVEHHHGRIVPIAGFDEVMLQLHEKLQLPFLLPELQAVHDRRIANYSKTLVALRVAVSLPAENAQAEAARKPVRKAAEAAVARWTREPNWWTWQLKADREQDPRKKEAIYRAALDDFPQSHELTGNLAIHLTSVGKTLEAGQLYHRALDLAPRQANIIGNFALFVHGVWNDFDGAERLYREALTLDPNQVSSLGGLAVLMETTGKNYEEAEQLYRKALRVDPNHATNAGNYADFLDRIRNDREGARTHYSRALSLDPSNEWITKRHRAFVKRHMKDKQS